MKTLKAISPDDLICMNDLTQNYNFRVEMAYAADDNLLFGERIYRPDAKLYLHKDLAGIVCEAATICLKEHKARFILYDGLRTIEAQERMMQTQRVKDNPQWLEEPRLLSPPGGGGHPRGMAIYIGLETLGGQLLDMGTAFDFLATNPEASHNPAHREHPNLSTHIMKNRQKLDDSMATAAAKLSLPLLPLPQEWWDFRLPPEVFNQYAPLSDSDLPPSMQLI
jgi:D-alanyl-D-alanine dipeptidase